MITFRSSTSSHSWHTLLSGSPAGYVDENDELMNSDEAFMSDAVTTVVGALVGTNT